MLRISIVSGRSSRDELLSSQNFYTLREAQIVIESWRGHYNTTLLHVLDRLQGPCPGVFAPALNHGRLRYLDQLRRPLLPLASRLTLNPKLTFDTDHLMGAGHVQIKDHCCREVSKCDT